MIKLTLQLSVSLSSFSKMITDTQRYDRQIRVYGLSAQQKLSQSNILILGIGMLAQEIAKNLVLAGTRSVTFYNKSSSEFGIIPDKSAATVLPEKSTAYLGILGNVFDSSGIVERCNEINPQVSVSIIHSIPDDFTSMYEAVIFTEMEFCNKLIHPNRENIYFAFSNGPFAIFVHPTFMHFQVDHRTPTKVSAVDLSEEATANSNEISAAVDLSQQHTVNCNEINSIVDLSENTNHSSLQRCNTKSIISANQLNPNSFTLRDYLKCIQPVFNSLQDSQKRSNRTKLNKAFFTYLSLITQTDISQVSSKHFIEPFEIEDISLQHQSAPICSVIGGFATQYVIKLLADTKNIAIDGNCFAFDSSTCSLYHLNVNQ